MPAVPVTIPLTTPDVGMTIATLVVEEVHKPPVVPSMSVIVAPAHIDYVPTVIGVGSGFTVTVA